MELPSAKNMDQYFVTQSYPLKKYATVMTKCQKPVHAKFIAQYQQLQNWLLP